MIVLRLVIVHCTTQIVCNSIRLLSSYDALKMSEGVLLELILESVSNDC